MNPKTKNLLQVNLAILIWGGTAMFAKGINLRLDAVIGLRSLVGAAAMLLFLKAVKAPIRIKEKGHNGPMLLMGLLLAAHWLTFFASLRLAGAAIGTLAVNTYPVFTALIEPFIFKEKLKKSELLLTIAVFAGVLIMTPEFKLGNEATQGILLGILSGIFFMGRNLLSRKYIQTYPSSTLLFWQMLVTALILAPVGFTAPGVFTVKNIGLLVLLGICFTALPQTLFAAGLKHLNARTVGVFNTLLVVYAAILGYFIHKEGLTLRTGLGGAVILAGIIFETLRGMKKTASPKG